MSMARVLVTGGAGFIGSHTCLELLAHDYEIVVADNFSNSSPCVLDEVARLSGRKPDWFDVDVSDWPAVESLFATQHIDAVVHFAALKASRDSVGMPIEYYSTNLVTTINLLRAMQKFDVRRMVFSSSCSIYGNAEVIPIDELAPPQPTNPYARSKLMCEEMLADASLGHPDWSVMALRYFNPAGAHESGDLGEDPLGVPNNVMPYITQVAVGRLTKLSVFGGDYPTPDGSCIRDYLHVMDLAGAHRIALDQVYERRGYCGYNLGTGVGTSVLELISMFERISGVEIPYEIVSQRKGDVARLVASPSRAEEELGWKSQRDLESMCRDAWTFQSRHPLGIG